MSKITQFYLGECTDDAGRTFDQIMCFKEGWMEMCHDYIQWLFPLPDPSNFHEEAPLLSPDDEIAFGSNLELRKRLQMAAEKFLWFLGLRWTVAVDRTGSIDKAENFEKRKSVLENFNHNHLRITRMMRCLTLCGRQDISRALYDFLIQNGYGSANSREYWKRAVDGLA